MSYHDAFSACLFTNENQPKQVFFLKHVITLDANIARTRDGRHNFPGASRSFDSISCTSMGKLVEVRFTQTDRKVPDSPN